MKKALSLTLPLIIFSAGLTGFLLWFTYTRLASELTLTLTLVIYAGGLAAVLLCLAALGFGLAILYHRYLQAGEETQQKRLATEGQRIDNRRKNREIATAPSGHQLYLIEDNLIIPLHLSGELDRWKMHQLANAKRGQIEAGSEPVIISSHLPEIDDGRPDLLGVLTQEQRLCIDGPSGSGKSSLLRHVVALKLPIVSQVLLCDPHGSRPKWGSSIDAIGFGEDFEAILACFRQLEWLHKQRIREVAQGAPERSFPVTLVVIEEIQGLVEYFKAQKVDIGHYIKMFLTRTRKTSIDVIAVTQASTVKALGLEGFGKNRDAFAFARTMGRDGRGHQVEYVNEHQERFVYDAPPLWPDYQPVGVAPQQIARLGPAPTSEQYKIIDALLSDPEATDYKISMEVWGKKGTSYKAKIDEVRRLFGPL
jgi:hypothetical protein